MSVSTLERSIALLEERDRNYTLVALQDAVDEIRMNLEDVLPGIKHMQECSAALIVVVEHLRECRETDCEDSAHENDERLGGVSLECGDCLTDADHKAWTEGSGGGLWDTHSFAHLLATIESAVARLA